MFTKTIKSARENPEVLRQKVQVEVNLGKLQGPFDDQPFPNLRVSPLGVIPKKVPCKFWLIHHLSYAKGSSVIDGISKECASVSYVSFHRAVDLLCAAGQGALMAKSHIKLAFRLLPIHPDCYHLLGCVVDDQYFFDTCLPMGCLISCHFSKC